MSKSAKDVLATAMELDVADRALVASELIASLDGPADADVESAWALEIERRVAEIDNGTVALASWGDVKRRIEKEILER